MNQKLRVIKNKRYKGSFNMALDEAIFQDYNKEGIPTLRFYQWEKPTLSLGYFQKSRLFENLWGSVQTDIVRRPTGGRGVIHDLELTYAVVGGYDEFFNGKDLVGSYFDISKLFQRAFKNMGINIEIEKQKLKTNSPNCFESPSLFEITLKGYKIIGSAQYRNSGKFLQHGSIILDIDYPIWSEVYNISKKKLVDTVKGISHLIDKKITYDEIEENIIKEFGNVYELINEEPTPEIVKKANALDKNKYSTKEWTYKK
ncbi:lipoate--protein ligase family protein [bacterium]|nr:lipoate--protein ligase family protein [bacterium]